MHFREIFDPLVQMREILRPEQIREISGQCHPHTTHPGRVSTLECGVTPDSWTTPALTREPGLRRFERAVYVIDRVTVRLKSARSRFFMIMVLHVMPGRFG